MFLTVPKEQICFLCHERTSMQQHVSSSTYKDCLACHDAHKSARAMLLRRNIEDAYAQSTPAKAEASHRRATPKSKSHASTRRHPEHPQPIDREM
jgi:predicted CXXCH cytochrome family protein